jgi:uncharacterized protein YdeI (YjbR/CyaY-like superfamily)
MTVQAEEIFFDSRASLRNWLRQNSDQPKGIWASYYKQSTGLTDITWDALVEECLCFGWIDSLPGKVDEQRTKTYIAPRKKGSGWSARNKAKVLLLEELGLIEKPGYRAIEEAKQSGSWSLFDLAEAQVLPEELTAIFSINPNLELAWRSLTDAQRRAKLQNFYLAKTEATRIKRIEEILASLEA